ncbi:3-oxoacyl-[acyl-carrier-protein] reductase [Bartonella sp. CDC_skunk]|uniref:3-oxoacyl-[acyl-carrier-protein] reductase n=1 Tax=Bartonella TaxID=773 RepID=UPI00099A0DB5|nr:MULTISPECIES: 3-oxoacyl-[acyl-carrier-protein] reductase [unclassified Bartonella]AQX21546.1 3-oxoacyl-[acyl-carrier-protein] reductase [Bartonella sp. CDC_skunk]AQX26809.1 3-oxoacyl-[acyl-carrier-protein] reductase [Bartonella sp. Raccoon60]
MFELTGRKALVTGASGDIGEAIARALHAQGVIVGLHGTREGRLTEIAVDLGKDTFIFPANLSNRDAVKQLAKTAEKEMDGIDILVNNAGITRDGLFVRMQDQDWDDVLAVNLTAAFTLTRELTYNMMRRRYGRIINITSIVGVVGNPGQTNYCAAKAGLIGFSKSLAQEVASRNITVNCIAPGFIQSAMTDQLNEKQKEKIMATIPMKRMGIGQEIASAVVYLASDEAGYVTGQTIHVNGGMAMI